MKAIEIVITLVALLAIGLVGVKLYTAAQVTGPGDGKGDGKKDGKKDAPKESRGNRAPPPPRIPDPPDMARTRSGTSDGRTKGDGRGNGGQHADRVELGV